MDKKQALGLRIKELREKNKFTQEVLAEKIGIDPKHLSRIENGRNFPSMETLEKLVINLNVSFQDLFQFGHISNRTVLIKSIVDDIKKMSDEQLKFIYKIIKELY